MQRSFQVVRAVQHDIPMAERREPLQQCVALGAGNKPAQRLTGEIDITSPCRRAARGGSNKGKCRIAAARSRQACADQRRLIGVARHPPRTTFQRLRGQEQRNRMTHAAADQRAVGPLLGKFVSPQPGTSQIAAIDRRGRPRWRRPQVIQRSVNVGFAAIDQLRMVHQALGTPIAKLGKIHATSSSSIRLARSSSETRQFPSAIRFQLRAIPCVRSQNRL